VPPDPLVEIRDLNFAYDDRAILTGINKTIQRGKEVAIMMDIKGPEIRTGDVAAPYELKPGEIFDFFVVPTSLFLCHCYYLSSKIKLYL
jgi:hypothetical protein